MGASIALTGSMVRVQDQTADKIKAFESMVSRDWDRFWRYSYRLCGNADDAEDLLSMSLLEAFQSFAQYRGEGFDKWIFRILTTNRIDMSRRAKVRKTESLESTWTDNDGEMVGREIPDERSNPERVVLHTTMSEPMQKALDSIPVDFRAAVLLCDVEQFDYQEIAKALKLPIGTVRSRIHRGRTLLRAALLREGDF